MRIAQPTRFIAAGDCHVGWERRSGRLEPIHDFRAWQALLAFAQDFKPDAWVEGGDGIDCGPISHWNERLPAAQSMPLGREIDFYRTEYLDAIDALLPKRATKHFHMGNHLRFVEDFVDKHPALEGLLSIERELDLAGRGWEVFRSNGDRHVSNLGKLFFTHGDKLAGGGGGNKALQAVTQYERCVRIFHHHTLQAASKVSAIDVKERRTGMIVPGMCNRNPGYAKNRPNAWVVGFLYGYVFPDGSFNDFPVVITNGKFCVNGKVYRG